jgi:hypothetical protein
MMSPVGSRCGDQLVTSALLGPFTGPVHVSDETLGGSDSGSDTYCARMPRPRNRFDRSPRRQAGRDTVPDEDEGHGSSGLGNGPTEGFKGDLLWLGATA